MNKKQFGSFILVCALLLLLLPLMPIGCSTGNTGTTQTETTVQETANQDFRGNIQSIELTETGTSEEVNSRLAELTPQDRSGWSDLWDLLKKYFKYGWRRYSVQYYTVDANNNKILVSGAIIVPVNFWGKTVKAPILALQHPTQVERKYSPSELKILDPQLTIPSAMAFCSTGYIVVVADYPGLGVSRETHPYCHASLANCVIDLIRASEKGRSTMEEDNARDNSRAAQWDGRLFLMGFSEGGYVTMATAKALQQNHSSEFTVSGVAPLDGPYSLSDTMRDVMLNADSSYESPYFLPYVLAGYESVYSGVTDAFNFSNAVVETVAGYTPPEGSSYADELKKLMDGSYKASEITSFMKLVSPYNGPCSILTESFISGLKDDSGVIRQKLKENDAFNGWNPQMPLKMFHNKFDDLVPIGNAENAMRAFGDSSNISLHSFWEFIPGLGSIHAGSLPVAYYKGYMWLDGMAYPSRHKSRDYEEEFIISR